MSTSELVLNIAVNLGRIARYVLSGNIERRGQFAVETEDFIKRVDLAYKKADFEDTWSAFREKFFEWRRRKLQGEEVVEGLYTWASILTHRAKLA